MLNKVKLLTPGKVAGKVCSVLAIRHFSVDFRYHLFELRFYFFCAEQTLNASFARANHTFISTFAFPDADSDCPTILATTTIHRHQRPRRASRVTFVSSVRQPDHLSLQAWQRARVQSTQAIMPPWVSLTSNVSRDHILTVVSSKR